MRTVFPSKILLAGEYTVLFGSDALAIPFDYYHGSWKAGVRSEYPFDLEGWVLHLSDLADKGIHLDIERMKRDYQNDIRFVSNVPQGGGLGSSGGITAAFYDRYVHDEMDVISHCDDVRGILSHMESYFHGESSGVDPLVSLTGQSYTLVNGEGSLRDLHIPQSTSLHLILTTTERKTAPLITFFKESMKKKKFSKRVEEEQIPCVHDFVASWRAGRVSEVEKSFQRLSEIEWDLCKPMITRDIKSLWKQGLETDRFCIKLCGAGGGGAYLACGDLPEDLEMKSLRIG